MVLKRWKAGNHFDGLLANLLRKLSYTQWYRWSVQLFRRSSPPLSVLVYRVHYRDRRLFWAHHSTIKDMEERRVNCEVTSLTFSPISPSFSRRTVELFIVSRSRVFFNMQSKGKPSFLRSNQLEPTYLSRASFNASLSSNFFAWSRNFLIFSLNKQINFTKKSSFLLP